MNKPTALLVAILAAGCASTPDDPNAPVAAPADLTSLPASGGSTDAQLTALQSSMTELLERLDVLNARIARLEEAPAPVAQQAVVAEPPARRVAPVVSTTQPATEQPPVPPPTVPPSQTSEALRGAQIADAYRNAILLYGRGRIADSRRAFQDVFDSDPSGELADNALFWIGETFFAANDFQNAMRYYRRVTNEFGDQNKAPDAMYKTALALARTGDLALARRTLEETIAKYPYSSSAASARAELKRIKY